LSLEIEAQAKLARPLLGIAAAGNTENLSERRAVDVLVRRIEVVPVEDVVELAPNLKASVANLEVLEEADVLSHVPEITQLRLYRRACPELPVRWIGERRRHEVPIARRGAVLGVEAARIELALEVAVRIDIRIGAAPPAPELIRVVRVDADRSAGLIIDDPGNVPSADERIEKPRRVAQESPAVAERQLVGDVALEDVSFASSRRASCSARRGS
jgi:hypothetical protein